MLANKKPTTRGAQWVLPIVQPGGEREESTGTAFPVQVPGPGYADKAQLARAALRNAVAAGHIGGRQGAALLRLAEAFQSRLAGQEVRCG